MLMVESLLFYRSCSRSRWKKYPELVKIEPAPQHCPGPLEGGLSVVMTLSPSKFAIWCAIASGTSLLALISSFGRHQCVIQRRIALLGALLKLDTGHFSPVVATRSISQQLFDWKSSFSVLNTVAWQKLKGKIQALRSTTLLLVVGFYKNR